MPIEHEYKFVMALRPDIEKLFTTEAGFKMSFVQQGYLSGGARLRQVGNYRIFTYKQMVYTGTDLKLVEIEKLIGEEDFDLLWPTVTDKLSKRRYTKSISGDQWDIDFFTTGDGDVYFIMAEVETDQTLPKSMPFNVAMNMLYPVSRNDDRFTSKKLSDVTYAKQLLQNLN